MFKKAFKVNQSS